jgi:phosphoribosylanthranilate isomerase
MLETVPKVNCNLGCVHKMKRIIVQIYEVQTVSEAEILIDLGVDHVGSVVLSMENWRMPQVLDTVNLVKSRAAKSSLIPLFNDLDRVLFTLDYYHPDIVHFCEALVDQSDVWGYCQRLIHLQEHVKEKFPEIKIMRSIPIIQAGGHDAIQTLELARRFESVSDFFLTDTLLIQPSVHEKNQQAVEGFVGITGKTCDWQIAQQLVKSCSIPVILAGGISSENVVDGIRQVKPAGIDSCTQTNAMDQNGHSIRFKKDPLKVKRLVKAVRLVEKSLFAKLET